jgi:putative ABC transport system permease protein
LRIQDLVRFAWRALIDRRLRAILTILGIVIGPATIVALLSVTQGFGNGVTAALSSTGSTSIFVTPSGSNYLTYTDVPAIQKMVGVSAVIPFWLLSGTIKQGTRTTPVQIVAGDLSKLNFIMPGLTLSAGREPSSEDLAGAVIGDSIAYPNVAGALNIRVDQIVTVSLAQGLVSGSAFSSEKSLVVRGIFGKYGQGFFVNPDEAIFISLSGGQATVHTDHYGGIVVVASSPSTVNAVTNELTNEFGQRARVTSVASIVSVVTSVFVAFVGIMTTMFTTVVERTREIGLLKAIGYKSYNILSLFLAESAITGLIGGVIGASVGAGLAFVIGDFIQTLTSGSSTASLSGGSTASGTGLSSIHIVPVLSPELLLGAVALATLVGALAGFLPAWRASRLLPVEALYSQ